MKKILVTAGGTAIAWHISKIAKEYFSRSLEVQVCDINEPYLVPASYYATKTHKVPYSNDNKYIDSIDNIITKEMIDVIIPLLPLESIIFASDSDYIIKKGIQTTAPSLEVTENLTDKHKLFESLNLIGVSTPKIFESPELIEARERYIIKPRLGFGSLGIDVLSGREILNRQDIWSDPDLIVQEYCSNDDNDETTVEVFNTKELFRIFARRRVATKSGVCVKTEIVDDSPFYDPIHKLVTNMDLPVAFNAQFLNHNGCRKLFDCNLRLGAGTALATAAGFQLTRGLLACIAEEKIEEDMFNVDKSIKSILRVYDEIVIR